jgi:hypothetical protein
MSKDVTRMDAKAIKDLLRKNDITLDFIKSHDIYKKWMEANHVPTPLPIYLASTFHDSKLRVRINPATLAIRAGDFAAVGVSFKPVTDSRIARLNVELEYVVVHTVRAMGTNPERALLTTEYNMQAIPGTEKSVSLLPDFVQQTPRAEVMAQFNTSTEKGHVIPQEYMYSSLPQIGWDGSMETQAEGAVPQPAATAATVDGLGLTT